MTPLPRNPGPSWGYKFLRVADGILPEWLFRPLRGIGTAIAMAGMPSQRSYSRDYLRAIFLREPSLVEVFRHFFAFEEALMQKLRLSNGRHVSCVYGKGGDTFAEWLKKGGPVFLGSLHVGVSDMLGFQVGSVHGRSIFLLRQRVGNSHDTESMLARFGALVKVIWVNNPGEMLFALKEAAATPHAIAMQCDRIEHSSRTETFWFLGAWRKFPFTIYHLALIFGRPVILSIGLMRGRKGSELYGSPCFDLDPRESRAQALSRAREHFQGFLTMVDGLLRQNPYAWHNFVPLNPVVPAPLGRPPIAEGTP